MSIAEWKDKLLFWAVTFAVASLSVFSGWVAVGILDRPSRAEVKEMIETQAPYVRERELLLQTARVNQKTQEKLGSVIERNTTAINDMRINFAKIVMELRQLAKERAGKR